MEFCSFLLVGCKRKVVGYQLKTNQPKDVDLKPSAKDTRWVGELFLFAFANTFLSNGLSWQTIEHAFFCCCFFPVLKSPSFVLPVAP